MRPEQVRGRGTFGRTDGWTDALPFFCRSPSLLSAYIHPSPVSDRLPHHSFTPLHSTPGHSSSWPRGRTRPTSTRRTPRASRRSTSPPTGACCVVWCGVDQIACLLMCVCRLARCVDGSPPYPTHLTCFPTPNRQWLLVARAGAARALQGGREHPQHQRFHLAHPGVCVRGWVDARMHRPPCCLLRVIMSFPPPRPPTSATRTWCGCCCGTGPTWTCPTTRVSAGGAMGWSKNIQIEGWVAGRPSCFL